MHIVLIALTTGLIWSNARGFEGLPETSSTDAAVRRNVRMRAGCKAWQMQPFHRTIAYIARTSEFDAPHACLESLSHAADATHVRVASIA